MPRGGIPSVLRAATLAASGGPTTPLRVGVINETSHKLPSGYPEGQRIRINVKFFGADGALLAESGDYDPVTATLMHDAQIKVHEIKPGLSERLA